MSLTDIFWFVVNPSADDVDVRNRTASAAVSSLDFPQSTEDELGETEHAVENCDSAGLDESAAAT